LHFSAGKCVFCWTDAIAPDAAKPQHFCLEVEARFREKSRSANGCQWRLFELPTRKANWPTLPVGLGVSRVIGSMTARDGNTVRKFY
jgi:hypothetical protein